MKALQILHFSTPYAKFTILDGFLTILQKFYTY